MGWSTIKSLPFWCFFAAAVASSCSALAQQQNEGVICVTVLRLWNGTPEEARFIETVPVPASYRIGSQSCGGPLRSADLMDWHDRYGSEVSARAAFDFVERRDQHIIADAKIAANKIRVGLTHINAVLAASRKRWATQASNPQRDQSDQAEIKNFVERDLCPSFDRLDDLLVVSSVAMRGAETFRSRALRDKADMWLAKFRKLRDPIEPLFAAPSGAPSDSGPQITYDCSENVNADNAVTLRTRLALFDAEAAVSIPDLHALDELIDAQRSPALKKIADVAFLGGDDFCDLPADAGPDVQTACADEPNFENRAKQFLYLEARTALLHGNDAPADKLLRIYDKGRKDRSDWHLRWTGVDRHIVALKVARAEMLLRQAMVPRADGTGRFDVDRALLALGQLVETVRLFNPADDIVTFRQIATRALEVNSTIEASFAKDGETRSTQFAQTMAYYRILLPNLDAIASGLPVRN